MPIAGESRYCEPPTAVNASTRTTTASGASASIRSAYDGEQQIGFCRAFTDGLALAYLADVYVLPEYRGRGLGEELVREMVERGPFADVKWILHTEDMHALYRKFGFAEPNYKVLERPATRN